jgi:hypothetical protein
LSLDGFTAKLAQLKYGFNYKQIFLLGSFTLAKVFCEMAATMTQAVLNELALSTSEE